MGGRFKTGLCGRFETGLDGSFELEQAAGLRLEHVAGLHRNTQVTLDSPDRLWKRPAQLRVRHYIRCGGLDRIRIARALVSAMNT